MLIPSERKKILLISSGQLSLDPRLVKEADALTKAGHEVTVFYAYWNDWGTAFDDKLAAEGKWTAVRIAGHPTEKRFTYLISKLLYKLSQYLFYRLNIKRAAEGAISRSSIFLINATKKHHADLYIGHNLGALASTLKAAKLYKKPCGFDAEDFHRQEVNDDEHSLNFQLSKYLEDKYLPLVNYLTAASPLIAERYHNLYDREVTTILNVFPKTTFGTDRENTAAPLRLFWFSQTIGPMRGIEKIIEAMSLTTTACELHLLGKPADGYQQFLCELAKSKAIAAGRVHFYEPIKANDIFPFAAKFDIGLASETGFSLNNNMALSNKIFTYVQCGLAIAVSNTPAQSAFINEYPKTGKTYESARDLELILTEYHQNRALLARTKNESFKTGQAILNWEHESQKFLSMVNSTLSAN